MNTPEKGNFNNENLFRIKNKKKIRKQRKDIKKRI